ncbi:MAG: CAP domain-containing protein [Syntrophobacteraceae bacterium]|nr:CAP domain-containing protein [Syntrophobacteraceae bacterium]
MKSGFLSAAILCMLLSASAAHSEVLLVADAGPAYGATVTNVSVSGAQPGLRPLSREVVRQRVARLDPEKLMLGSKLTSIKLDLFHDLHLSARLKEKQRDSNGFLLWTGAIEGIQGGKLILVVREGFLYASVYLPTSIIQIRPVAAQGADGSQRYVIRELAYPWRSGSAAGSAAGTRVAQNTVCPDCTATGLTSDARKMVELVNLERKADGLPALEYNGQLTEAARRHAVDMASHDICSHEMSNGEPFYRNVFASGYPVSTVGENLAAGLATPEEAFECLLSSSEHRSNIMNSDFRQIGVSDAVNETSGYRYFWAQEFGAASDGSEQTMQLSSARPHI